MSNCPFYVGSRIQDARYFVGRRDELDSLTTKMTGDQPTSVNVVGKHRIGKSSLLYHFFQTYEQRVLDKKKDPKQYVVIYLSLESVHCQQETNFYQAVAKEFLKKMTVQSNPVLKSALTVTPLDRQAFSEAIIVWKDQKVLPVLCLDNFEAFLKNKKEFDTGFYNNLRALMDSNSLMLIIASCEVINDYSNQYQIDYYFFNLGHVLRLEGLKEKETIDLVRLPEIKTGKDAVLNEAEQKLAIAWGKYHPCLLQLAGTCLFEAQQKRQTIEWAKAQFDQQAQRVPRLPQRKKPLQLLVWVFWKFPLHLGNGIKGMGIAVNEVIAWGFGMVLVLVIILALMGFIPGNQVHEQFRKFVCGALSSGVSEKLCQ